MENNYMTMIAKRAESRKQRAIAREQRRLRRMGRQPVDVSNEGKTINSKLVPSPQAIDIQVSPKSNSRSIPFPVKQKTGGCGGCGRRATQFKQKVQSQSATPKVTPSIDPQSIPEDVTKRISSHQKIQKRSSRNHPTLAGRTSQPLRRLG